MSIPERSNLGVLDNLELPNWFTKISYRAANYLGDEKFVDTTQGRNRGKTVVLDNDDEIFVGQLDEIDRRGYVVRSVEVGQAGAEVMIEYYWGILDESIQEVIVKLYPSDRRSKKIAKVSRQGFNQRDILAIDELIKMAAAHESNRRR